MWGNLAEWVIDVIGALGYLGIAALVALENLFPPIPSEVILPLAGFQTGRGRFSFLGVVAAATGGSVGGALVLYGLGAALGKERVRRLVARHGRWILLTEDDLDRASRWFDRHGGISVLIGRCVPGIRSLISIPAGINRMPIVRFLAYTTIGSALWNILLVGVGWALGENWRLVRQYMGYAEYVTWAVVILALAWFLWRRGRLWRNRRS